MAKIEIIQSIDATIFSASTIAELKRQIEKYYSSKGYTPEVEVLSSNEVRVTFDSNAYEKVQANIQKATNLCGEGRLNAAKDLLLKAIKACPFYSETFRLLGQIYYQQGNIDKAIDTILEALRLDPKNMWALILMGNAFANGKQDAITADRYYRKVLEYYPNNVIAINNIAGAYLQKEEYEKGILYLKKALELDDSYLNCYYGLALAYYKQKNYKESFDIALLGVQKGNNRPENPGVRQELLKLLLTVSRNLSESIDYKKEVYSVGKSIESKYGVKIEYQEDDHQNTLAHLEFADFYHRSNHVVKYKRDGFFCHHMLHELMHLEMMLEAKNQGTLQTVGFKQENFETYLQDNEKNFEKVKRQYGLVRSQEFAKQIFHGMSLQVMNCPLDLFVEQRIYEKEIFRPLQIASLFAMEQANIDAVKQTVNVDIIPQQVKDINKLLNMVSSLMLKNLYSLDFIYQYKPSSFMLDRAKSFFARFMEIMKSFQPGNEYELFSHFANAFGVVKYFNVAAFDNVDSLVNDIQTEAEKQQEKFDKVHNPDSVDPTITMMMAMYMLGAMEYFEGLLPEEIKKIAFDCALVGQNGIDPAKKNGYALQSVPGKDFGGYELLAYYYTSWAYSVPEMLGKLNLPFADAYEQAKEMFEARGA